MNADVIFGLWYPKIAKKKVREKSRECHNNKPQPFPDPKRKRKPTNLNKHKPNKRMKSTKVSSLFPKRGNRNTKRTEKYKNKMTHGKTYNKSPRRINRKATKSKTNTGTTALERSVEQTTGGFKALLQLAYSENSVSSFVRDVWKMIPGIIFHRCEIFRRIGRHFTFLCVFSEKIRLEISCKSSACKLFARNVKSYLLWQYVFVLFVCLFLSRTSSATILLSVLMVASHSIGMKYVD